MMLRISSNLKQKCSLSNVLSNSCQLPCGLYSNHTKYSTYLAKNDLTYLPLISCATHNPLRVFFIITPLKCSASNTMRNQNTIQVLKDNWHLVQQYVTALLHKNITLSSVFPRICPKSIGFLENAVLWLNSWPIQKKSGIKGFFSVSDETEASRYRCAKTL